MKFKAEFEQGVDRWGVQWHFGIASLELSLYFFHYTFAIIHNSVDVEVKFLPVLWIFYQIAP